MLSIAKDEVYSIKGERHKKLTLTYSESQYFVFLRCFIVFFVYYMSQQAFFSKVLN